MIPYAMETHEDQEDDGQEEGNTETAEVRKVEGEDGCEDQDVDNKMVTTTEFYKFWHNCRKLM